MTDEVLEIQYKNLLEQEIIVLIEPWAERIKVAHGASFKFRVLSQEPGSPLTKLLPGGLIFEFWKGVTLEVLIDDQPVDTPSLKIPVPF